MTNRQFLLIYLMPLYQLAKMYDDYNVIKKETTARVDAFLNLYRDENTETFRDKLEETFGQEVRAAIAYVEITRQKSATSSLMFIRVMMIIGLIASFLFALSQA